MEEELNKLIRCGYYEEDKSYIVEIPKESIINYLKEHLKADNIIIV